MRSGLIQGKCLDDSLFGTLADIYSLLVVEECGRLPLSSRAATVRATSASCLVTEGFLCIWGEVGMGYKGNRLSEPLLLESARKEK